MLHAVQCHYRHLRKRYARHMHTRSTPQRRQHRRLLQRQTQQVCRPQGLPRCRLRVVPALVSVRTYMRNHIRGYCALNLVRKAERGACQR